MLTYRGMRSASSSNFRTTAFWFGFDTGTVNCGSYRTAAPKRSCCSTRPKPVAEPGPASVSIGLTGLAGTHAARPAIVRTLRVGTTTLTNVPAVLVKRAPGTRPVDGLLPMHLFARVTFNGPERQLFIEPR